MRHERTRAQLQKGDLPDRHGDHVASCSCPYVPVQHATMLLPLLVASLIQASPPPPVSPVPFSMPPVAVSEPGLGGERVDVAGVFGNFYRAHGKTRAPGVLLLGGSEGGLGPGAVREAQALAEHGFAVLQLAYFGAPATPKALVHVPLETFDRGLAWLAARKDVDGRRLAVMGTSKGAEAALLIAAAHPELKAVVAASPSAVVWPGIDFSSREMNSSWSRGGQDLAFIRYGTPPAGTPGLRYIFTGYKIGFDTLPQHPEAAIPVERIRASVRLICGEADTLWPSCPMARAARDKMIAARPRADVTVLSFADAGHAVFGPPVDPSAPGFAGLGSVGGSPEANNAARREDWPEMLAFLDAKLGG